MKMKFLAVVALAGTAMAVPTTTTTSAACPALLLGSAQCCSSIVLELVGVDCAVPPSTPNNPADLRNICSSVGKQGACCGVPVAGLGLLCQRVPAN